MKKLLFLISLFLVLVPLSASAEIDYSLINAPLLFDGEPVMTEAYEENGDFSLFSFSRPDTDEEIYEKFKTALSPDNFSLDNIQTITDGENTEYGIPVTFAFSVALTDEEITSEETKKAAIYSKIYEKCGEVYNNVHLKLFSKTPELFYLTNGYVWFYSYSENNDKKFFVTVKYCMLLYKDMNGIENPYSSEEGFAQVKSMYAELVSELDRIADEIRFDGMTDFDKLLLAHDYIASHCAYYKVEDYYGDNLSYSAYGVIINKKAVCQGYSFAYEAILSRLGFDDVLFVVSDSLNHVWNLVKLDGKWYNIDVTWDDPMQINYDMNNPDMQLIRHNFFLISQEKNLALRNISADNCDFKLWGIGAGILDLANDTSYESGLIMNTMYYSLPNGGYYTQPMNCIVTYDKDKSMYRLSLYQMHDSARAEYTAYVSDFGIMPYILSQPMLADNSEVKTPSDFSQESKFSLIHTDIPPEKSPDELSAYTVFYDNYGRCIAVREVNLKIKYYGIKNTVPAQEVPPNAASAKILVISANGKPYANFAYVIK